MSISDIKKIRVVYFVFTIFIFIFGFIYEMYSHQVYSIFMQYAFVVPLLGLICIYTISKLKISPNKLSINLFNSGIMTLTVGSIIKGFLDIYGTTNSLIIYYPITGLLLIFLSIITFKNIKL